MLQRALPDLRGGDSERTVGAVICLCHVLLDAPTEVLRHRIIGAADAQRWRLEHLVRHEQARGWMTHSAVLVVDTRAIGPDAGAILASCLGNA